MKAPLNWIKDYVKVSSDTKQLIWKMTEIGLTCESYETIGNDKILDIEVTPNRPDWLSITGISREIAIVENTSLTLPKIPEIPKPTKILPINIKFNFDLIGGYAGITIANVKVADSPKWLTEKLIAIGLRPINNLVDITNFVMFEFGIPIHVFDYDKFQAKELTMTLTKGGEPFESVDEIKYKLPSNTLVIKDKDRVADLCGIKGGANTAISAQTTNIYIHVPIYQGAYIRKTSQVLKLRSDASYIYERGPNPLGIEQTLKRVVSLVLDLAGGEVASKPFLKTDKVAKAKELTIDPEKLSLFLGIEIQKEKVIKILKDLEFKPVLKNKFIICETPYFRSDINLTEDIYEEIARIYGLNNFERTLPRSGTSSEKIPYLYDRTFELKLKSLALSSGYFEIASGGLTSKDVINACQLNEDLHIKIVNPVSSEYEYMRTSLIPALLQGIKTNFKEDTNLFEYGKVYFAPVDKAKEVYKIAGVSRASFQKTKGVVDYLLEKLNISEIDIKPFTLTKSLWHPTKAGVIEKDGEELGYFGEISAKVTKNLGIRGNVFAFELNVENLKKYQQPYFFKSIPVYPPQIEDLTFKIKGNTEIGKIIDAIKRIEHVLEVNYIGSFESSVTMRIYYSDPTKTLKDSEVAKVRKTIKEILHNKYQIKL